MGLSYYLQDFYRDVSLPPSFQFDLSLANWVRIPYLSAIRAFNFDIKQTSCNRRLQLNELDELHNETYEKAKTYKEKTKISHEKIILGNLSNLIKGLVYLF